MASRLIAQGRVQSSTVDAVAKVGYAAVVFKNPDPLQLPLTDVESTSAKIIASRSAAPKSKNDEKEQAANPKKLEMLG